MVRRFRVELFESNRSGNSGMQLQLPPPPPPMSHHVDQILVELNDLRRKVNGDEGSDGSVAGQQLESAIAVWSGVDDIQRRLEVTKAEISALESKGIGSAEKTSRTTDELRAVITGTEEATDTILAAAETIDAIAQRMALRHLVGIDLVTALDQHRKGALVVQGAHTLPHRVPLGRVAVEVADLLAVAGQEAEAQIAG